MCKVDVEDRLTISANHAVTAAEHLDLAALGFTNAAALTNASFLQNTEDSEDEGLDLIASQALELNSIGQSTDITLSLNFKQN